MTTLTFADRLLDCQNKTGSCLCVGLDPDFKRLPPIFQSRNAKMAVADFCREIIDHTGPFVCAFKPQFAHFAAIGAENELSYLIDYIHKRFPAVHVILDAKRGDIESTAERYAVEAFLRYQADSVTVNPYMGFDSIEPFLRYEEKGVFVLCRTSNPSAWELQDQIFDGAPLYSLVAKYASERWNIKKSVGLVVGAPALHAFSSICSLAPGMPLLVPGFGIQNGDLEKVLGVISFDKCKRPVILNVSRSINYIDGSENFAVAAGLKAKTLRDSINDCFGKYSF